MKNSEFWAAMAEEFGAGYAPSVATDQVLSGLGGRTAKQALADGEAPRAVWRAVCEHMEVPSERRLGPDPGAGRKPR